MSCLLLEDEPRTRDWLVAIIGQAFPGMPVTALATLGEAQAWLTAYEQRRDTRLRLALIDLALPDGSGTALVARLAADHPAVLPVVATIYDDDAHLFEAIAAGARGYLLKDEPAEDADLTIRESETLGLLAKGLTVAEAATQMGLKPQTVASYVKVIYHKLNVSTRAEATLAAVRRGLV